MTPEEALQIADEVVFAHIGKPLTDLQRMILRESLADKGYEEMEQGGFIQGEKKLYRVDWLKHVGLEG